ncbi:MAG: heme-binding protein [Planctomycetota bacterium]
MTKPSITFALFAVAALCGCSSETGGTPPAPQAARLPAQPELRYHLDEDTGITLPEGFDADLVYDVPEAQGSWVAMDFDGNGRLLVSDQDDKGMFRVTLPAVGDADGEVAVESLSGFPQEPVKWGRRTVWGALGFLFAFDSLYMSTMKGFYRVRDTDGDDQFDEFVLLKKLHPGWEHSAHTIVLTEDGEGLYLISGNHSRLPDGVRTLHPQVYANDTLLPSMPDPSGHARGIGPPAGWIARVSPDGEDWTMIAHGLRNGVDLAINREGELFTCDSDLEFDVGSPWYRPTRVNHVTSASEFGWRTGSAKWPDYYADSMGSVCDLGPGSPTGIQFGHHSDWPSAFQDKLFVCDWTFGTIYTVELHEDGSSYRGTKREFLHGEPLNISAMRFGPDGHMYFLIGGRNTDSKLYRVRYVGQPEQGEGRQLAANQELRDLRHSLERFHGDATAGKAAVDAAWPHLGHADRGVRYAARLAIESQDVALWRERALQAREPRTLAHAGIALARHGDAALGGRAFAALSTVDFAELPREDQLAVLRAWGLCLIRLDDPGAAAREALAEKLLPCYPSGDEDLDAELCRLLCRIDAPAVVEKTVALMKTTQTRAFDYDATLLARHEYGKPILEAMAKTPNSQNIHYAYCLRGVQRGWTRELRKDYFGWLNRMLQTSGGKSFSGYIRAIREDAIAALPDDEAAAVAWLIGDVEPIDVAALPQARGPGQAWTRQRTMALFDGELRGRDFQNGKNMFQAGQCVLCHRFAGEGGRCGPDLGSVGRRFSIEAIVASICEPNDTIAEQYQASIVRLKDGSELQGRVIWRDDQEIAVATNAYDFADLSKAPSADVAAIELSPLSMMPPNTIGQMNADEVKDLIAYLISGGNKRHRVFRK